MDTPPRDVDTQRDEEGRLFLYNRNGSKLFVVLACDGVDAETQRNIKEIYTADFKREMSWQIKSGKMTNRRFRLEDIPAEETGDDEEGENSKTVEDVIPEVLDAINNVRRDGSILHVNMHVDRVLGLFRIAAEWKSGKIVKHRRSIIQELAARWHIEAKSIRNSLETVAKALRGCRPDLAKRVQKAIE